MKGHETTEERREHRGETLAAPASADDARAVVNVAGQTWAWVFKDNRVRVVFKATYQGQKCRGVLTVG